MQKDHSSEALGPPHKMRVIPVELLQRLPRAADPPHPRGPLAPRRALIAGSWWLTREVELATARAALIRFCARRSGDHAHPWILLQEGHARLPLLPTFSGEPCTKLGITATIEAAAVQVGLPRRSPEGMTLWTDHPLRVGGAQSFAVACLDT